MFIYLSKKIAIPNNTKLKCLAWNKEQGYIACGGEDGLLKVLKLESGKDGKLKGLAAPSNLSMNQTLEGHSGQIQVITWNEIHQKLTTSDQYGLIIVWTLYKGAWYEEMINNRNKSVVKGMAWNSDGQKICIVYEDGAVIVGSVDGNRIWGKELKGIALTGVEWSPDGKMLLFSLRNGEIHVYDNQGSFTMKLTVHCLPAIPGPLQVVGMDWYDGRYGYVDQDCPVLAICYQNGCMQIMRGENDDMPVLIDTGMAAVCCRWNHNGSIIAVTGIMQLQNEPKDCNVIQFFTPFGELLRTLKIPGHEVNSCVWEGGSLRVALAVDSFIYFANIRPDYKWTYFQNTVVYCYNRPDRPGTIVTFWDTKNNECYNKNVRLLLGVASSGEHCVLATRADDIDNGGQYGLILCNAISTPVDTKYTDIEPLWTAMNSSHVFAASHSNFLLWHYRTPKSRSTFAALSSRQRKERLYHIDDTPSGVAEVIQDLDRSYEPTTNMQETGDPICCMCATDKMLVIGRESGMLQRYSLPQVALTNRYSLSTRPYKLSINCNSTRLAVIDVTGVLTFLDLESYPIFGSPRDSVNNSGSPGYKELSKFERKDVWAVQWASDNPELLAIMEKTRMYVLRGLEPEEPILSSGYICSFQELEIRAVLLDEIMQNPERPTSENILDMEVKSLRDTRDLLDKVGIAEATTFIEENPHPRLWRLLAEAAVQQLDLSTAEAAFVRCSDYPGIQFVKRLQNIQNDTLKKAEVAAYFQNFNDAEKYYLEVDRRDLAISLREKLGDWFRVVQLMKMGAGGSDVQMEQAWNSIGNYFADRQNWEGAREYYEKGRNQERLVHCYYMLEDYAALESCVANLPDKHSLLPVIGEMFASVGMCAQAVMAYTKYGQIKPAVDACVGLNQWDQAVELAKQYKLPEINDLLSKYASHLLAKNKLLEAVELYRKANHFLDAAKLLFQMAEKEGRKHSQPQRIKKLYVLAALLVEEHQQLLKQKAIGSTGGRSTALMGLLNSDTDSDLDTKHVDNAWKGAEAYHFFMLAQKQLYEGNFEAAMKTALHLREYEDILESEDVYCILALASSANKAFGVCSKAFIKLESLETISEAKRQEYEDLAMDIFTKYTPKDSRLNRSECTACETMVPDEFRMCPSCGTKFPSCIATGRPLLDMSSVWTCGVCKHCASEQDMIVRQSCPLCHASVQL
ncbi:WD repeat-containing protein 35 isoform X1 [Schistocerca gregaria]|uniref:WD repeat-containing protein 35 isoform X1 n=2 Tax=Schistocerca gregaria TaxID=7010 RepID=UPI00211E4850|nr:WD repeat-containing protein 35 isoform X1 [Schistocerca gregaria]